MDSSSYTGLPNKLFQGLDSVKSSLSKGHILEKSETAQIETNDKFLIRGIPCDAKIGDNITASYDVKVKDREHKI